MAHLANEARKFCVRCTERDKCREWRIESNSQHGVWAGELYTRKEKESEDGNDP